MNFYFTLLVLSLVCQNLNSYTVQHNPTSISGSNVDNRIGQVHLYKPESDKECAKDIDEGRQPEDDSDKSQNGEENDDKQKEENDDNKGEGNDEEDGSKEGENGGNNQISTTQTTENPINLMLNQNFDLASKEYGLQQPSQDEELNPSNLGTCGCNTDLNFGLPIFGGAFNFNRGGCGCS